MKFSRNPTTGVLESYDDDGTYVGIVSTFADIPDSEFAADGGPGSGNFGHKGRPGLVGGSSPGGGKGSGKLYRHEKAGVGFFGTRKDWLNGLEGEEQHKAARFLAEKKRDFKDALERKGKIEKLFNDGHLTRAEADEQEKKLGVLDLTENSPVEQFIVQRGETSDIRDLLSHVEKSRNWEENKSELIKNNLSDEEQKAFEYLEFNPDYSTEETHRKLYAKALGLPMGEVEIPEEVQYASGIKERPKQEGPDYSWYENKRGKTYTNLETYMQSVIGETPSYAHRWTLDEFKELNKKFVNAVSTNNKLSPTLLGYYAVQTIPEMRKVVGADENGYYYGNFKYTPEMFGRLTQDEKNRLLQIVNVYEGKSFAPQYHSSVDELDSGVFYKIENRIWKNLPKKKEEKELVKDYVLLQEKMLTGETPPSEEEQRKMKEQEEEEARKKEEEERLGRIAIENSEGARIRREKAKKLREDREAGKPVRTSGVYSTDVGKDRYEQISAKMDECKNIDVQVAWDIYHSDVPVEVVQVGTSCWTPFLERIKQNMERDSAGDSIHAPMEAIYHEMGHAIDQRAAKALGYKTSPYSEYPHFSSVWNGGEFCDIIEKEGKEFIDKISAEAKIEFESTPEAERDRSFYLKYFGESWDYLTGRKEAKWGTKAKYKSVESWLEKQNHLSVANFCDTLQGVSKNKVNTIAGHDKSYYLGPKARENMATEVFAELYSCYVTHPNSLEFYQKYMPKTVECFDRMIKEIAERG